MSDRQVDPTMARRLGRLALVLLAAGWSERAKAQGVGGTVEVEEVVASAMNPGNGAGPLWAYGAPLIVRHDGDVFASVMEVGAGVPPLCNTRWRLCRRGAAGWAEVARAGGFREREPCPIAWAGLPGLLLSINPAVELKGVPTRQCDPQLLRFDPSDLDQPPSPVRLEWSGSPRFTEHSYRGLATDPSRGEVLALNIDGATDAQRWAWVGPNGRTLRAGEVRFPIRACYPQVALRDRAAHVLALGDVVEPVETWREHKARSGSTFLYVFRRLFYTGTPDLAAEGFAPPLEVDSVDATGGEIRNLDLRIDEAGAAHLLYLKANGTPALRDRFFPGDQIARTLEWAVVERGRVTRRRTLINGGEGRPVTPVEARFHESADLGPVVIASVSTASGLEMQVLSLARPNDAPAAWARLDFQVPLRMFVTANPRGGTSASGVVDLLGLPSGSDDLRYARVRLR